MGAYQLKITMKGSKPPIWRRILVPEGITFQELYRMIQTAFCWNDDRLYQFEFRSEGVRVTPVEENRNDKFQYLMSRETIDGLLSGAKKFTCTYGPDDDRELEVQAEEPAADYRESYAQVIKFKGDGVPENCASSSASGSPQAALAEPEEYDMDAVNERLKRNAVSQSPVRLAEAYESYDKNSIMEIAKRHGMSGYSKYKKEELIRHTIEHVLDREKMRRYFLCVRDFELKLFEQAAAGNCRLSSSESEELDYLYAGGYVVYQPGESGSFLVTEEVAKAFGDLNTPDFQEERARISRIGDYFRAANYLYVITPPSVILETFNKYEEKKLTQDELMQAYELLQSCPPPGGICGRQLCRFRSVSSKTLYRAAQAAEKGALLYPHPAGNPFHGRAQGPFDDGRTEPVKQLPDRTLKRSGRRAFRPFIPGSDRDQTWRQTVRGHGCF